MGPEVEVVSKNQFLDVYVASGSLEKPEPVNAGELKRDLSYEDTSEYVLAIEGVDAAGEYVSETMGIEEFESTYGESFKVPSTYEVPINEDPVAAPGRGTFSNNVYNINICQDEDNLIAVRRIHNATKEPTYIL